MLEESISCSPGNIGKKSRSRRFRKNNKKKCEKHNVTPTTAIADNTLPEELSGLEALYEESTHAATLNANTHFEYFYPFENEKLLAAAERAVASTSRKSLQNFASKGFVRLESLPIKEENKTFPMKPPERPPRIHTVITPGSPHVLGPETQFGITESEFMRFCEDAESDVLTYDVKSQAIANVIETNFNVESEVGEKQIRKSKSIVEEILTDFCCSPTESEIEQTPPPNSPKPKSLKGTKSIVDEILEDFCGSPYPYRESSPKVNSEDSTPIFRFKSQPIRTYSNLRKKKLMPRNIANDMMAFTLKDDGNTSDSSSGLSVQEDLSQSIVPKLDTVDLNNSVKLCENLLNLSSYFSQLPSPSSKERTHPIVFVETKEERLSAIVEEIIKIKPKSLRINWNRIEETFLGFSDSENDSKESTLQELLEDEDDVLQQINCDSLSYEKVEPKVSFTHRDIEMTLQNASDVIEKAKALLSSELDVNLRANNLRNKHQPDYDIKKDIENKSLLNSTLKDEQLFDDIDIWNDNECLLNYKTQKPLSKRFKESKDRDPCSSVSLNLFSNGSIKNEIKELNEKNLNEREQIPTIDSFPGTSISFSCKERIGNKNVSNIEFRNESTASKFVGFATVSKKPILVSDIARQKANEFLKKFEQQECDERMTLNNNEFTKEDMKTNKSNISTKTQDVTSISAAPSSIKQAHNTSPSFVEEFSTTSKSKMLISPPNKQEGDILELNGRKKREIMIGETGFKENKVQKAKCDTSRPPLNTLNNNFSVGFSTASKKIISISTKAKQKADELLKEFEQDEQEKRMPDTIFLTAGKSNSNYKKENVSEKTVEDNSTVCGFVGFSTASEKPIAISLDAKRKADEILKKFEQIEEDKNGIAVEEKLTQRHPDEISEEVRRKAQELLLDIEFFEEAFEDELKNIEGRPMSQVIKEQIVGGFKTASRKSIHISEEASRRAETFLKGVYDEDLPQEFLKYIETDNNDTSINGNNAVSNLVEKIEQVDGVINNPRHLLYGAEHTHVSKELETMNKRSPVSEDKMVDHRTSDPAFEPLHGKKKHAHLESPEYNNTRHLKRKHSERNDLEKLYCDVTPRRLSCEERTPLNVIENGLLCKSSSLPLKECTPKSTLISRKNLLSLSKRKKIDSLGQIVDSKNGPNTPEKEKRQPSSIITNCNASSIPNLKDFFESVSTSTPRLIRNDPANRNNQNASKDAIDSDFRLIQWEDPNNSFRINRTGCVDDVNVSFSQISPSPKQRIERLKMYGEPPPISPILMINKCRTSGLRRGRSSMKP